MKSKKIIHLTTTIERGGAEKQLLTLIREQIRFGLDVEIFYLKGKPELKLEFEGCGASVNQSLLNKSLAKQIWILRKYLNKDKSPLHAHLPKSELIAAFSCPKSKFIFTRHNSEAFWPSAPKFISNSLSRFVSSRSAYAICISNAVKKFIIQRGELSKKYRLETIHYGFEIIGQTNFQALDNIKDLLRVKPGVLKIGSIGRLVKQKDFPTLLKALKQVTDSGLQVELFIVGDGVVKDELSKLAEELQISEKVHWLGRTNFVNEFLSQVDLFVLSSIYEGFGLVLLEAMQANKPILAANNSSIPEVLGENYAGLFETSNFQALSSLIRKFSSEKLFSELLVSNNTKRLDHFRPEIMSKKIIRVYEKSSF